MKTVKETSRDNNNPYRSSSVLDMEWKCSYMLRLDVIFYVVVTCKDLEVFTDLKPQFHKQYLLQLSSGIMPHHSPG